MRKKHVPKNSMPEIKLEDQNFKNENRMNDQNLNEPFQISQAEIEKIKAEELLRLRIKKELEPGETEKNENRFWGFLNSSFGLLFFSAIFISGIGTL